MSIHKAWPVLRRSAIGRVISKVHYIHCLVQVCAAGDWRVPRSWDDFMYFRITSPTNATSDGMQRPFSRFYYGVLSMLYSMMSFTLYFSSIIWLVSYFMSRFQRKSHRVISKSTKLYWQLLITTDMLQINFAKNVYWPGCPKIKLIFSLMGRHDCTIIERVNLYAFSAWLLKWFLFKTTNGCESFKFIYFHLILLFIKIINDSSINLIKIIVANLKIILNKFCNPIIS